MAYLWDDTQTATNTPQVNYDAFYRIVRAKHPDWSTTQVANAVTALVASGISPADYQNDTTNNIDNTVVIPAGGGNGGGGAAGGGTNTGMPTIQTIGGYDYEVYPDGTYVMIGPTQTPSTTSTLGYTPSPGVPGGTWVQSLDSGSVVAALQMYGLQSLGSDEADRNLLQSVENQTGGNGKALLAAYLSGNAGNQQYGEVQTDPLTGETYQIAPNGQRIHVGWAPTGASPASPGWAGWGQEYTQGAPTYDPVTGTMISAWNKTPMGAEATLAQAQWANMPGNWYDTALLQRQQAGAYTGNQLGTQGNAPIKMTQGPVRNPNEPVKMTAGATGSYGQPTFPYGGMPPFNGWSPTGVGGDALIPTGGGGNTVIGSNVAPPNPYVGPYGGSQGMPPLNGWASTPVGGDALIPTRGRGSTTVSPNVLPPGSASPGPYGGGPQPMGSYGPGYSTFVPGVVGQMVGNKPGWDLRYDLQTGQNAMGVTPSGWYSDWNQGYQNGQALPGGGYETLMPSAQQLGSWNPDEYSQMGGWLGTGFSGYTPETYWDAANRGRPPSGGGTRLSYR